MLHPGEYTCRTSTEIETAARDLDWLKEGAFVSVARPSSAGAIYEQRRLFGPVRAHPRPPTLAARNQLRHLALQAAHECGRLRIVCARPRAFGAPQDGMRPAGIHDDFRRQLLGVVGTDERHGHRSHCRADPRLVALPSGDLGRCRTVRPDHLGDDTYARNSILEAVGEVAAVALESMFGALIPVDGVRELDLGCISPERLLKNSPSRLSQYHE